MGSPIDTRARIATGFRIVMRRRAGLRVGLRLLAALAIACASTGAWACDEHKTQAGGKSAQILVPGVIGDSERLAIECLRRYGYTPKLGGVIQSDRPEGTVARTVPAEGTTPVGKSRLAVVVEYWVSAGATGYDPQATNAAALAEEAASRRDSTKETRTVRVPDLQGRSLSSAKSRLKFSRLVPGEVSWHARGAKAGRVLEQVPAAGTRVPLRTRVDLVVSNGGQAALVPDVVGKEEMSAIGTLSSNGLNATRQGRIDSPRPAGTVLRTVPSAGSEAPSGAVTYWVASGRNVVPDLRGKTRAEATQALRASGFAIGNAPPRFDDGKPNRVVEQKPEAGAVVTLSAPVSVSLGKPRTVPKVVGMLERDARKALAAAGLKGARVGADTVSSQGARVVSLEPRAGMRVKKNATVRYTLAQPAIAGTDTVGPDQAIPDAGATSSASAAPTNEVTPQRNDDAFANYDRALAADNSSIPTDEGAQRAPVVTLDTPPTRENVAPVRDDVPPAREAIAPTADTGTDVGKPTSDFLQDAIALVQRGWRVIAGSTTLALVLAGVWWTQLRSWPWHWPPPRPRTNVRLKPAEPPWPMMSPLDHDPSMDVRIRVALAQGETTFDTALPLLDTEIRHG